MLPRHLWAPLLTVTVFAVLYGALMDAGAKKFDRYVLPVFPIADLLAAVGWVGLARILWSHRLGMRPHMRQLRFVDVSVGRSLAVLLVLVVGVGQIGAAWSDRPYGFDYYNPLMGGSTAAQQTMMLGWGEGLDQAGDVILDQPGGATSTVRTSANQVTLLYYLPPSVSLGGDGGFPQGVRGLVAWGTTDYYVSYTLQWQRDFDPIVLHQVAPYPALDTIFIHGVPYARVYALAAIPPPPDMVATLPCTWQFGDQFTLLTYNDQSTKLNPDDPNRRDLDLFFQAGATSDHPLDVQVELVPRFAGLETINTTTTLEPAAGTGLLSVASLDLTLPRGTTTDFYSMMVSLRDPDTGRTFPARSGESGGERTRQAAANACVGSGAVN